MAQTEGGLKIKDCIVSAAVLLGLNDIVLALEDDTLALSDDDKASVDLLVRCANLVFNEIASDYLPLRICEQINCDNGKIFYNDFGQKAIDIFAVKSGKKSLPFKVFYDHIYTTGRGLLDVEYSFEPVERDLSGVSDYTSARLSKRCVSYGVAAEYCSIAGMSDEAVVFNRRYRDTLDYAKTVKKQCVVKARAWR